MKVFTTICVLLVASLAHGRHLNDAHVNDAHVNDAKPKSDETKAVADESADAVPQKEQKDFWGDVGHLAGSAGRHWLGDEEKNDIWGDLGSAAGHGLGALFGDEVDDKKKALRNKIIARILLAKHNDEANEKKDFWGDVGHLAGSAGRHWLGDEEKNDIWGDLGTAAGHGLGALFGDEADETSKKALQTLIAKKIVKGMEKGMKSAMLKHSDEQKNDIWGDLGTAAGHGLGALFGDEADDKKKALRKKILARILLAKHNDESSEKKDFWGDVGHLAGSAGRHWLGDEQKNDIWGDLGSAAGHGLGALFGDEADLNALKDAVNHK